MKKLSFFDVGVLITLVMGYLLFFAGSGNVYRSYRNDHLGIAFRYPAHYFLEERPVSSGVQLVLTEDTEENRVVREGKAPGREGPTAIVIGFESFGKTKPELMSWILNSERSNFKLSDAPPTKAKIAGADGYRYRWDGLYPADQAVFAGAKGIIYASATYLRQEDLIRADFDRLLNSFELTN